MWQIPEQVEVFEWGSDGASLSEDCDKDWETEWTSTLLSLEELFDKWSKMFLCGLGWRHWQFARWMLLITVCWWSRWPEAKKGVWENLLWIVGRSFSQGHLCQQRANRWSLICKCDGHDAEATWFCKLMVAAKTMYCLHIAWLCPSLHSQASLLVQPTADRFGGVSK